MATTALYRKNGGECGKISTTGQAWPLNADYQGVLTDPETPDGTLTRELIGGLEIGPSRVLGYAKIALPGTNTVRNATQEEIDAFATAQEEDENIQNREAAKVIFQTHPRFRKLFVAVSDIMKDEVNIVRGWTVDFKAEVAAATSLADLKTRVAGMATLADRTLVQFKTAINNRMSEDD